MLEYLYPDVVYENIYEIDFDALKIKGIIGLIFDIDNTLVKPHEKCPNDKLVKWMSDLADKGFKMCILSNATQRRVQEFAAGLDIPYIHRAWKPSKKGFLKALDILNLARDEVCIIGDQLFTDVRGGKRLGIYTVYTKKLVFREEISVMLKRIPEAIVFMLYYRPDRSRTWKK